MIINENIVFNIMNSFWDENLGKYRMDDLVSDDMIIWTKLDREKQNDN